MRAKRNLIDVRRPVPLVKIHLQRGEIVTQSEIVLVRATYDEHLQMIPREGNVTRNNAIGALPAPVVDRRQKMILELLPEIFRREAILACGHCLEGLFRKPLLVFLGNRHMWALQNQLNGPLGGRWCWC